MFNLKLIGKSAERLIIYNNFNSKNSYDCFVSIDGLTMRIQRNGPGYDESKLLCRCIWEMFAGWNISDGAIGCDSIERQIETA